MLILSEHRRKLIIRTLLCLMPIVGMAVDLIAPSLPAIADSLNISSATTKNIITIYLLGYALGNFLTGFLTDALGRQKLIRIGLVGFIFASLLPIISPYIIVLLLSRFLQGLTIGAVAVVARAILSDILPPQELVRLGVIMGSMFGLGPVIGPLVGGYLQFYLGWQACFAFFAIISIIAFIAVFIILPETHFNRHPLNIKNIRTNLLEVLSHKKFMAMVLNMGAIYSLIIAFNTVGPFLIQNQLKYTPVFFGHIALCMGVMFILATFTCRYLLKKYKVEQLFLVFINTFFVIALLALVMSYIYDKSITLIAIASAFMFFACGIIFPMSMGKGISLFRHIAGTATATMYFINVLMTSITALILSFVNIHNAIALMWTYFLLISICAVIYWSVINKNK